MGYIPRVHDCFPRLCSHSQSPEEFLWLDLGESQIQGSSLIATPFFLFGEAIYEKSDGAPEKNDQRACYGYAPYSRRW